MNNVTQAYWSSIQFHLINNQPVTSEEVQGYKNSFETNPTDLDKLLKIFLQVRFSKQAQYDVTKVEDNLDTIFAEFSSVSAAIQTFIRNCIVASYLRTFGNYAESLEYYYDVFDYNTESPTGLWYLKTMVMFEAIALFASLNESDLFHAAGWTDEFMESVLEYAIENAEAFRNFERFDID